MDANEGFFENVVLVVPMDDCAECTKVLVVYRVVTEFVESSEATESTLECDGK